MTNFDRSVEKILTAVYETSQDEKYLDKRKKGTSLSGFFQVREYFSLEEIYGLHLGSGNNLLRFLMSIECEGFTSKDERGFYHLTKIGKERLENLSENIRALDNSVAMNN